MQEIVKCEGFNQKRIPQQEFLRQFKDLCLKEGTIIQQVISGHYAAALVVRYVAD